MLISAPSAPVTRSDIESVDPIILLGEKLSPEMILGGILVLTGIYVMEHHKSTHAKHAHFARHVV